MKQGRKSNKQRIKEKLNNMLSVKEVIKLLKNFPQDAKIGVSGHFGEFYGMTKHDFHYTSGDHRINHGSVNYITPDGSWSHPDITPVPAVLLTVEDIGPDPD